MRIATLALGIALAVAAIPAIRHLREEPPPPPPAVHLSLSMPQGVEAGWGDEPLDAAITADASRVALVGTRDGIRQLWLRRLDAREATPLPGTEGAQMPAWKQTGNTISFFADGFLKAVSTTGAQVQILADSPAAEGATWLADGSLVFAAGNPGPLQRLRFGQVVAATTLAEGDQRHAFPVAVAGRDDFVYVAVRQDGRRIVRLSVDGLDRDLTTTSGHAALVGGHLLHVRDGALLAYARDPETGALAPRGTPLALDVGVSSTGRALFAAAPGLVLHAPAVRRRFELAWLDETGARAGAAGDIGDYWQVRLSPDDGRAAVTTTDPLLGSLDILLMPTSGAGDPLRLTTALAADTDPVWSPDAIRVLFRSLGSGRPDLFSKRVADRGAAYEEVLRSDLDETPTDWNGDSILFQARGPTNQSDIYRLSTATGERTAVLDTPFNETDGRFSPDGRWIAFVSDESGRPDVYVRRPDGSRLRLSFGGGTRPRWAAGGTAIVFLRGSQLMRAERAEGDRFTPAGVIFEARGIRDFDASHRGSRLLAIVPAMAAESPSVSAILNWMSMASQ